MDYLAHTNGNTMRTITVKLEDDLAAALDRLYRDKGFTNKSELIREAAEDVESRMHVTEEVLARVEGAED